MIKNLLYRWMLPKLIDRQCESRIPRSGRKGEQVDCFVVSIDHDESPFFIATEYENKQLKGLTWDGQSYAKESSLLLNEIENGKFRVTHYYGLSEITYDSIFDIVWHHITRYIYLKINLYRRINKTHQYFFNKRKLVTKKRMALIQFMMDDQLGRTHSGIDTLDLMTKLYSINWVLHPSRDEQQNKLELYLDSLVKSGELEKINHEYIVTGQAISTIEKYEEEERRHVDAIKLQRRMFWLTILILLVAIVQSGIVKLPILLDLSAKNSISEPHNRAVQPVQKDKGLIGSLGKRGL